jgi:hypothetical protein
LGNRILRPFDPKKMKIVSGEDYTIRKFIFLYRSPNVVTVVKSR